MMYFNTIYVRSILPLLRGVGQVMFQDNALSGLLMCVGLWLASPEMAVMALLGCGVSTLAAAFFRYPAAEIESGLYGFNGALVGIASVVLLHFTPVSLCLAMGFSIFSTWLVYQWKHIGRWHLPPFTFPFILSTWLMLAVSFWICPDLLPTGETDGGIETEVYWLDACCLEIGQVMFAGSTIWSGFFFLLGIAVNSRLHTLYALWGAILPVGLMCILEENHRQMNDGLWGYNAVLVAIALSGSGWKSLGWSSVGIVISVFLQMGGMHYGIPTLTAPFVGAVWVVISLRRLYGGGK